MSPTRAFAVSMLAATGVALVLRLPGLNLRPMHGDEAVHAVRFNQLWTSGHYEYDPQEYHGPTLYYLTLPIVWLSRAEDFRETQAATYRLVPALFGAGLIPLLWLLRDGLGRTATLIAGLLTAVSPAMVFYSRYYIQETLLVFFSLLVLAAGWRFAQSGRFGWAMLAGAGIGLMQATKETCVLALAALAGALVLTALWQRRVRPRGATGENGHESIIPSRARQEAVRNERSKPLPYGRGSDQGLRSCTPSVRQLVAATILAGVVGVMVSVLLFSGFVTHPQGALDAWRAYPTYLQRAAGDGVHDKPWFYYLRLLLYAHYAPGPHWSEALIVVLAGVGAATAVTGRGLVEESVPLVRFIGVYALLLTAVYSAIPYKTPWCLLGFLHGMILLAGVGTIVLLRWLNRPARQAGAGIVVLAGVGHLCWQANEGNWRFYADPRNPYVYAHPGSDVARLGSLVEQLAGVHPDQDRMLVRVLGTDYWPLPWYLRRLERVGYWETLPPEVDAPVIITTSDRQPLLDGRLRDAYFSAFYGLRPDVTLAVYVQRELWNAYRNDLAAQGGAPPPVGQE